MFERDVLTMIEEIDEKDNAASAILLNVKKYALEDSSFDIMYERLSWLQSLQYGHGVLAVNAKANKVAILYLKSSFTKWLDRMLSYAEAIVHDTPYDISAVPEWLIKLTRRAYRMVDAREELVEFHTSGYGIIKEWPEQTCKVVRSYAYVRDNEKIVSTTLEIVLEVICSWTAVHTPKERWRMWLLDTMINVLGSDIIFLNGTWDIFENTSKYKIFQKYTPNIMTERSSLIPFENCLKAIAATPEWEYCMSIAGRIREVLWEVIAEGGDIRGMFPYIPPQISTMDTVEDPKNKVQMQRGVLFLNYIREALAVIHEDVDITQPSKLQQFILSNQNNNCPFRDCIEDFTRMTESGGPYFGDTITTEAGIYSAVLWRAITSHTTNPVIGRVPSEEYNSGNAIHKTMKEDPPYMSKLNTPPYETTINHMQTLAGKYRNKISTLKWPQFCQDHHSFKEIYELFHPVPSHTPQPFENLGPLGTLQLMGDLGKCGVAPLANNADIGWCIKLINSGSAKGAAFILGDIDIDKKETKEWNGRDAEYYSRGAQQAYTILEENLSKEDKEIINFNEGCMIEHALRTFWTAVNTGAIE